MPIVEISTDYMCGDTHCGGTFVYDSTAHGAAAQAGSALPGVVIFHQFYGPTDYERMRAGMLAELGYCAFVADIYGSSLRPQTREEASAAAGSFRADTQLLRARCLGALKTLAAQPQCDSSRLAAIGYCFGGRAALELARSGANIAAAVSFHGTLATQQPAQAGEIQASLLALHGADDPHINDEQVQGFIREMREAKADWQLVHYGGAAHSFTEERAGSDPSRGAAYNAAADRRSWQAMQAFLAERFAQPPLI